MSGPRNRIAFERGQRARTVIGDALLEHARLHPFARRLTWRQLQAHLALRGIVLERSTICWHVQQLAEIDRTRADSSSGSEAA